MPASFRFHRLRFRFTSSEQVFYPASKAGNVVRGALGTILREISCHADCPGARICDQRSTCAYARIFEPVSAGAGPSGLHDRPRPFVLRASHLDGAAIRAGESFAFDLHLFLTQDPPVDAIVKAFTRLAESGLGPGRGRVRLESAQFIGLDGAVTAEPIVLALSAAVPADPLRKQRLRIHFVTPTELKQNNRVAQRPDFALIITRVAERIGNLSELYGGGKLEWDWRGLVGRAAAVQLAGLRLDTRANRTMRFSTKTGQTHGVGGFTGEALYEGAVAEFLPMLEAAKYCGIGRHTVWGNGMLEASLAAGAG